jgi:hypothetical protein
MYVCMYVHMHAVAIKFRNDFIASLIPVYLQLSAVTFDVLTWISYALILTMLPLLETFLELLLRKSFQCRRHSLFGCFQHSEIFVPLRQTLFLETARSHSEPNQAKRVGFFFH